MHQPESKKDSPTGSGEKTNTNNTNTEKTHSTDSKSESDQSEGTGQQRSSTSKTKKKLDNNFACTFLGGLARNWALIGFFFFLPQGATSRKRPGK